MLPITSHITEELSQKEHSIESYIKPDRVLTYNIDQDFSFLYCVAYRDPSLPEWILARGYWNDNGIWDAEGIFPM